MRHQICVFLRLVWGEWASRVTGSLSAILVLLGLGINIAGAFGVKIPANSVIQLGTWLLAAICGGQASYSAWAKERLARDHAEGVIRKITAPKLQILFDSSDGRFARPSDQFVVNNIKDRYFVGLQNISGRTLEQVTLHAHEGTFVAGTIARAHARHVGEYLQMDNVPLMIDLQYLHPGAIAYVELFYKEYSFSFSEELLRSRHEFRLEARARDAPTIVASFEYDPAGFPRIRMLDDANC